MIRAFIGMAGAAVLLAGCGSGTPDTTETQTTTTSASTSATSTSSTTSEPSPSPVVEESPEPWTPPPAQAPAPQVQQLAPEGSFVTCKDGSVVADYTKCIYDSYPFLGAKQDPLPGGVFPDGTTPIDLGEGVELGPYFCQPGDTYEVCQ